MEANKKNELLAKLRVQIEFYLSDENLKGDKFFHDKILSDTDGYVDIPLLLNCNKIKNLGVNKEDIIASLKNSSMLELSSDENRIRRLGNKALPQLKLLAKKRQPDQDVEAVVDEEKKFDPTILEIHSDKDIDFRWKEIQDEFKRINPDLKVIYLRFSKNYGHIGLDGCDKWTESFELNGFNFTVNKCAGDNLIDFWKDHGSHFDMCVGKGSKDKKGRDGRDKRNKKVKEITTLKAPVQLGDETFSEVPRIKAKTRTIFGTSKNNDKISGNDHQFLLDLLKHHKNADQKLKDLSYFTVSPHPEHTYSRCFFIVRNDGSREDFSAHKCIENMTNINK